NFDWTSGIPVISILQQLPEDTSRYRTSSGELILSLEILEMLVRFLSRLAGAALALGFVTTVSAQSPQLPGKVIPQAVAPSKQVPVPVAPSKQLPTPVAPTKVIPTPVAPSKVLPAPVAPSKQWP